MLYNLIMSQTNSTLADLLQPKRSSHERVKELRESSNLFNLSSVEFLKRMENDEVSRAKCKDEKNGLK